MDTLKNIDILSASQFTKVQVDLVLSRAKEMREMVQKNGGSDLLKGKIMTALFYEPSSRSFRTFVTDQQRLGGGSIPLQVVTYSLVSN